MSDRHCCWDAHACPRRAVAVVMWRQGSERGHMQVCDAHLLAVRMKAAIRGVHVYEDEGPDKACGGQ